jgi:hypothetical protein
MKAKYILFWCLAFFKVNSFGHEQIVHEAITANAIESAQINSPAYAGFINAVSSDATLFAATNSMVFGSFDEDFASAEDKVGGNRSYNHFYDPLDATYSKGLSDIPPDIRGIVGTNSFAWATISNCLGVNFKSHVFALGDNIGTSNTWSWQNARYFEWRGLTATNQLERQTNLLAMFRAVGQVMHLLEDTSQPQHVRNEQHVFPSTNWWVRYLDPWISPIEEYGKMHVFQLYYGNGTMLNWRGADITKLEDFWDRHLYSPGNATILQNAESGGTQLGLAEWCNGNFLGARHLFPEYSKPGDIEYYPYPSRNHSTDYSDVRSHPALHVHSLTLKNKTGQGVYLKKTSDGITGNYIARVNYLGVKIPNLIGLPYCTIDDPNVEQDYHDAFIPKAVEYSAGLLDYFFRGSFTVTFSSSTNLTVLNTSGQDFSGGAFFLFADDTNHIRTFVMQTNLSVPLPKNQAMDIIVSSPAPADTKYFLVYQGTIGVTDGTTDALDPVDAGIGIAVAVSSNTVWQSSFEGNGETDYLAEEGDYFAEGWHVDSADVNVQVSAAACKGTHFININGDSGQPGVISTNVVTVPGLMYRLNFAYSENPDGRDYGDAPTGVVQAIENDNLLLTLTVDKPDNTWDNLEWSQASATFTADSSVTQIRFASQTANVYGVLLDAVSLEALSIGP